MLFKMILREECNVGARLLGWCSRDCCTPWENTNQEPPTDFTDAHRSGGYGRMPYPPDLCASVKSVGEYSTPEVSVNSVDSVGELAEGGVGMAGMPYPPTKTPTDCTDVHRLGSNNAT